jgi:precorrin-6B methylase 2
MPVKPQPKANYTDAKSRSYAKGGAGYPDEVIDFIIEHCNLKPGDLLIDVGSGTGISSRLFGQRGLKVVGIESSEGMRQQAQLANDQLKDSNIPT